MSIRARKVEFRVADEDAGRRLDQVLAARIPELSRRKARVLLDIGGVFVERTRVKVASRKVRPGQLVEAHLGGALERATKDVGQRARKRDERALPAHRLVFEDDDLAVIDKPAGLLTAPTPESDRGNLADILARERGGRQVFVVHRLDLATSGLLVMAKTNRANKFLSERFRTHDVIREYTAVVSGRVVPRDASPSDARVAALSDAEPASITVDLPLRGRRAVTNLYVTEYIGERATVLRARLETGRTHQIRLHCRHIGHAVLGDRRYGRRSPLAPPRMALHASMLGFVHPRSNQLMSFASPLPAPLADWLQSLRSRTQELP